MSEPSSAPDPDEAFLLQFQQDYEAAADKGAVVEKYCALRPDLAKRIRARAAMAPLLGGMGSAPADPVPERLGEFRILRVIGGGGMGQIYEAQHERLGRRVAVKTIRPDRASPEARERFRREQQALARLHQTHIVAIYQAGEEGPVQYFAMPYIDGAALHHVVRAALQHETAQPRSQTPTLGKLAEQVLVESDPAAGGSTVDEPARRPPPAPAAPPPPGTRAASLTLSAPYFRSVAEALADAAEALHHAHGARLLHRDVKPSNLMVDRGGRCWLIDFGLAGLLAGPAGAAADPLAPAIPVTTLGLLGTPPYMAPEQWAGGELDARTDVWGLGVTLYELLTLRRAFDGSIDAVRTKILMDAPVSPRRLVGNVPADLAAIQRKAMQKDPGKRYTTALDFADDLRRWLRGEPTTARPAGPVRRTWMWARRNRGWATAIVVAVAAAAALAVGGFIFERNRAVGAEELAQTREREALLQRAQRLRLTPHAAGWSEDGWELVRRIRRLHEGEDVKAEAASFLSGLDAQTVKTLKWEASAVAFDADGRRLLMGGLDGQPARLWDRKKDEVTESGKAGDGPVAFDADGTPLQLMSSENDPATLVLWDVARQKSVQEFALADRPAPRKRSASLTLALSPDGAVVAGSATFEDGTATLAAWEARSGKLLRRAKTRATALAFAGGAYLAFGDESGQLTLWTLPKCEEEISLASPGRTAVTCLAFRQSPFPGRPGKDAKARPQWLLASGDQGGVVRVWDVESRSLRSVCRGSMFQVYSVAFSPDGTTLASAGRNQAKLWDAATGAFLLDLGERNTMTDVAFSPDGREVAVSSVAAFTNAGGVDLWRVDFGRGVNNLHGLEGPVTKVQYSPKGDLIAGMSQNWQVGLWEADTGRLRHIFDAPQGVTADNAALAFNSDGSRLAFAGGTGAVLWDTATGAVKREWALRPGLADAMAFRGEKLLLFRQDWLAKEKTGRMLDLLAEEGKRELFTIDDFSHGRLFIALASPDGRYFVAAGAGGKGEKRTILAFDGVSGEKLWSHRSATSGESYPLTLDPWGNTLAFHDDGESAMPLVEMPLGKQVGTVEFPVECIGPHARRWLKSPVSDKLKQFRTCLLFGRGEERPLATLASDTPAVAFSSLSYQFSPDGQQVAWGNTDGSITVCDLEEVQRRLAAVGLGW